MASMTIIADIKLDGFVKTKNGGKKKISVQGLVSQGSTLKLPFKLSVQTFSN